MKPKVKKNDQILQRYNYHEFRKYQKRGAIIEKLLVNKK
jgi:hypothetical protein